MLAGDHPAAMARFRGILARDPGDLAAWTGLGDAAAAGGEIGTARRAYARALAIAPERRDLRDRLAAPALARFRLDLGTTASGFDDGRAPWADSVAALSVRVGPDTTLAGGLRAATRYGRTERQIEASATRGFPNGGSASLRAAAAPGGVFLPRASLGAGGVWPVGARREGLSLSLDARRDHYAAGPITTLSPGLRYAAGTGLGLSLRWLRAWDDAGTVSDGYVLGLEAALGERLRIGIGFADAPEIVLGTLVASRTVFADLAYDLREDLALRATAAREDRETGVRSAGGLGLTLRF
jgi:YaiO family outer membrane protein